MMGLFSWQLKGKAPHNKFGWIFGLCLGHVLPFLFCKQTSFHSRACRGWVPTPCTRKAEGILLDWPFPHA